MKKKFKIAHFHRTEVKKLAIKLLAGRRFYIAGIGTFYMKKIKERKGVGFNGKTIVIPAHNRIKFKPSSVIKRFLNE